MLDYIMVNVCMECGKNLDNPKARFCTDAHRMKFKRWGEREGITRTLISEKPEQTDNPNIKPEQTSVKVETVTGDPLKKLVFTTEPIEERVKKYKELFPDSGFVPNWITNGFNTR